MEFDPKRKCALCLTNQADKANTHYLTDSVIRRCLNENGSNIRGQTSAYTIDIDLKNKEHSKKYHFGQRTSEKAIKKELKREPTDEEIEEAKKTGKYAVDYVFCTECEKKMADKIESPFADSILNKFRAENFNSLNVLYPQTSSEYNVFVGSVVFDNDNDIKKIRLFFLLQLWRLSICRQDCKLDTDTEEMLRKLIVAYDKVNVKDLKKIPLAVSYINIKNNFEKGVISPIKKYMIIMCDFLIEYNSKKPLGIINKEETEFKINIVKDDLLTFTSKSLTKRIKPKT